MAIASWHSDPGRLEQVTAAFASMPERFLGADPGTDATFHIRLADIGRTWEVHITDHACRVRLGISSRRADVTIDSDASTWLAVRAGRLSGIEAFSDRRLAARGDLDLAVGFEGMFHLEGGRPPLLRIRRVPLADRGHISALTMGQGPDVMLVHGLGSSKASFLDTATALARRGHRVHAIDLPGFGNSSKPRLAAYDAPFFADAILRAMDALDVEHAHLVGNSMGGRASIEVGLTAPERVDGLVLLCPAVAFVDRPLHPLVRLLRPELGALPHTFPGWAIEAQFWSLFADRDEVDPSLADVVVDEFRRVYASSGARVAFLKSARNIYLEAPFGRSGFYPRLTRLRPPALFVWGTDDKLVPSTFSRQVAKWLPSAEQIVLQGCGHVPQIEHPARTNNLIERFCARTAPEHRGPTLPPATPGRRLAA